MPADELAEQFALVWDLAMGDSVGEHPQTLRILGVQKEMKYEM